MQKEFYFSINPQNDQWNNMWTARTIDQELEACEIESPPRELFLSYLSNEDKIVDAGCGFAKWVIYLKRLGYDILGIDNNELAISKLKDYDSSLQVELGDILDIHYPDSSFDAYISMGVVEHFEGGPLPALKEAYRVLKPNGLIFVSVPTANVIRKIIRREPRNAINALILSLILLASVWGKSRRKRFLAAAGAIVGMLPQRIAHVLANKSNLYYHFSEYRYSRAELENFLKQAGFEIVRAVAHDFYGSKAHAAGLMVDFPFLAASNGANFRLNPVGRLISRTLNGISPWIACSSVLCVARSLKKQTMMGNR